MNKNNKIYYFAYLSPNPIYNVRLDDVRSVSIMTDHIGQRIQISKKNGDGLVVGGWKTIESRHVRKASAGT
jgi:hypothetical protein